MAANMPDSRLFRAREPVQQLEDLVLPPDVLLTAGQLVEEHHLRTLLRSHGVEPRHRVLLTGPPGNGKSSLAETIATEIAVPLLTVRYETLIGSDLGETGENLDTLISAAQAQACVLLFADLDTIAGERGDPHGTGELNRLIGPLLAQLDRLPSHVVVVAAASRADLLDSAVLRWAQIRLSLPRATLDGMVELLQSWSARTGVDLGLPAQEIADRLLGVDYADLVGFASDIHRRSVIAGPGTAPETVTRRALEQRFDRTLTENITLRTGLT